ncbi:MAG: aquaporin family protein [Deltaproteobacteria bacterium]|nr:aquaporin family protein [Deltaproteobacteria bacterium]
MRRFVAELIGTAFLLCAIVGSGIMGETLANGNVALALLANSLATGLALMGLILIFTPISGAHFNPLVTLSAVLEKKLAPNMAVSYLFAQVGGAFLGVWAAHLMFGHPVWVVSHHARAGVGQYFSEWLATFGLLAVIHGCKRYSPPVIAFAVGGYITSAYWFTASTSFANPAVTLARAVTDTFTGIRPSDVLPFVAAQIMGALSATFLFRWFWKE